MMSHTNTQIRILPVLAVCAAGFLILRVAGLTIGTGEANAQADIEIKAATVQGAQSDTLSPAISVAAAPPSYESRADRDLYSRLKERKEKLDAREQELETREKLLRATEQSIETKLALIREERAILSDEQRKRADRKRLEFKELSNAYGRMKARDAARIFETLDEEILIPVAAGMRVQALSGVLAEMSPEKARSLTKALAAVSVDEIAE